MAVDASLLAAARRSGPPLKSRKSPRQSRALALVAAILEAAARIIEDDPAAFTTNRVAELAGVSIGSLYQYFPNKQALLAALIEREQAAIVTATEAVAAAPGLALGDAITALINAGLDHQLSRPRLAAALDVAERELPVAPILDPARAAIAAAVATVLARAGFDDVEARAADLLVTCRALIDALAAEGADRAAIRARLLRALPAYLAG